MSKKTADIGVVIVTFNRLAKLKKTLQLFEAQSISPLYIIVVDNASTDGTVEFLEQWKQEQSSYKRIGIFLRENTGGSGGFYTGLKESLSMEAQWVWVSDDDAFPELDALEAAQKYLDTQRYNWNNISAICGQVLNQGKPDLEHRRVLYAKRGIIKEWIPPENMYTKEAFEINTFSYVGTIINRDKMEKIELTRKDYFIWFDDTEHSLRLGKIGRIICVPAIKIHHNVKKMNAEVHDWRSYYRYRNMADCYQRNFPRICYLIFYIKAEIKVKFYFLFNMDRIEKEMLKNGIRDAKKKRLGLHCIYRPGWKIGE